MAQYATLRISKGGGSSLEAHIERDHVSANVDKSKVKQNLYLHDGKLIPQALYKGLKKSGEIPSITKRIDNRIKEGYTSKRKIREDTNRQLNFLLTGSHDQMTAISKDENMLQGWVKANMDFLDEEFGKDNTVSFAIHMDEATPHIHATVVPLTDDGRLSAKERLNGIDRKAKKGQRLIELQDIYADKMKQFDLERGISAVKSQTKHTTTAEYYREIEKAKDELQSLTRTTFKFESKKEKAIEALAGSETRLLKLEKGNKESFRRAVADVRSNINLIGLAESYGYKIDKPKSCSTSIQMKKGTSEIVISTRRNGDSQFFERGSGKSGNAIDFLQHQGKTWEEIAKTSSTEVLETIDKGEKVQKEMPTHIEDLNEANRRAKNSYNKEERWEPRRASVLNYLTSDREIPVKTVKSLSGLNLAMNRATFKTYLYDIDEKLKHTSNISYRGINPSKKELQSGLPKGWAMVKMGDPKAENLKLIVCESPIDGISYAALQGIENAVVMASCGNPSKLQLETLEYFPSRFKKNAVIAADHGPIGQSLAEKFLEQMKGFEIPIVKSSKGKDWNEQLILSKKPESNSIERSEVKQKSKGRTR